MQSFIRRQTDLEYVESSPIAHSYLLRKPRTHEPTDETLSPQRTSEDEKEGGDPIKEKRESMYLPGNQSGFS